MKKAIAGFLIGAMLGGAGMAGANHGGHGGRVDLPGRHAKAYIYFGPGMAEDGFCLNYIDVDDETERTHEVSGVLEVRMVHNGSPACRRMQARR